MRRSFAEVQRLLSDRLSGAATVVVTAPGLGETDQCSAVMVFGGPGKQHHGLRVLGRWP